MGNDCQNFQELALYCEEHPEQKAAIIEMLGKLTAYAGPTLSEESFIRMLYHLDPEMKISAEVLRFIALYLYPFYARNELALLSDKLRASQESTEPHALAHALKEMRLTFDTLCTGSPAISLKEASDIATEESDTASDTRIAEEMEILEESLELAVVEGEKIVSAAESDLTRAVTSLEEALEPRKLPISSRIHLFLQRHQYFIPHIKIALKWMGRQVKTGFLWLQRHRFFWPQMRAAGKWCGRHIARGIRWVRDEQEYYVWLRSYQGKKVGYYVLLKKKTHRIRMSSTHRPHLKKIYESDSKETLRVFKGILTLSTIEKEEREPLNQLKDLIIMREKVLTQPETVLDVVNYGHKKFHRMLRRAGRLSNVGRLNKKITAYFLVVVEKLLDEANGVFRKGIETCSTYPDLKRFMTRYPLYRLTTLEHYKSLEIILLVKKIIRDFELRPLDLTPILNQYLGPHGEANLRRHLIEVLVNSHINEQLWDEVAGERYFEGMLKCLKRIPRKAVHRPLAESLVNIVSMFMSGAGKFTFTDFKASLNFVPEKLQNKITRLVSQKLQEDLSIEVNTLLMQHGKYMKRLQTLRSHLTDPRYQGTSIAIFGYPPLALEEKINMVEITTQEPRHIFSNPQVPDSFIDFVMKAKRAEAASQEKTVSNCLGMLKKIEEAVVRRERINLHNVLVNLFKVHGKVNFALSTAQPFTGYEVANEINRFYNTPDRSTLTLSDAIAPEVKEIVKNLVDAERQRQIEKMEKYGEV